MSRISPSGDATLWASGRVALITGATSGFGLAVAERLLAAGARVIATGRRRERLDGLADRWPERCLARALDVRDPASIRNALSDLPGEFADIDVLFNNAGLALGVAPAQAASLADWDAMIATNVSGLVHVTHQLLPGMVARDLGQIINMGSVAGVYPYPGGNVYGATKAFVRQFSLNLRADLVGTAVKVTCLEPGMAETEFSQVRLGDETAAARVYAGMSPLTAGDIADTVEFLLRLPKHMNLNTVELMPVQQAFAPFAVSRAPA